MNSNPLPTAIAVALGLLASSLIELAPAQGDPPAESGPVRDQPYALVVTPARRVSADLTIQLEMPRLAAQEWIVYAAQLPVLPSQTGVSSTLLPDGQPGRELSPEHRPILRARIPAMTPEQERRLDLRLEYQATLWARRLVRNRTGQDQDAPASPPLGSDERRAALASGGVFDFNSAEFRRWLDELRLRIGPEDGEIDFARRIFLAIKAYFRYIFENGMDRHASRICRAGQSDCGGLAIVFVSALRANRIPARMLVGRWATSSTLVAGQVFDQQHAKAEFFAQGIGWVS